MGNRVPTISEDNKRDKLNRPTTLVSRAGWLARSYRVGLNPFDPEGLAEFAIRNGLRSKQN